MNKKKVFALAGISTLSILGTAANADILIIDIGGLSTGGDSIPDVVLTNFIGANAHVTGMGFDVTLETFGSSWADEAVIAMGNTAAPFVFVTPGANTSAPLAAPTAYSSGGITDLIGLTLDFTVGADGMLVTTLFESFDDGIPAPDGMWLAGSTVTIEYFVPAPGCLALLSLAGLAMPRRRRRV